MSAVSPLLVPRSAAENILADFRTGAVFASLLDDDVASRSSSLAAIIEALTEQSVRIVWIGNPLRSPLTVERFFLQATGPDVDVRLERDPAVLARCLVEHDRGERVLVVQQPESLDPELRDLLAAMAPQLARLRILFCGTSAFRPLRLRRDPLAVPLPPPVVDDARALRRWLPWILLALLLGIGAAALYPPLQAKLLMPPASHAAAIEPAPAAATTVVNVRSLRQHFETNLGEPSPGLASLTQIPPDASISEFDHARDSLSQ